MFRLPPSHPEQQPREMLPSQQELTLQQGYFFNVSISFPNFTLLRQNFSLPLSCSPSPPPFTARAACLHLSTPCSLPGELSWTVCHPQQTQAFIFLLCSECPFMAHPARCFLLCSCTPLSETLRAPCLSAQTMPIHLSRRTQGQMSTTSLALMALHHQTFALTLPPAMLPLISPSHRYTQHPLVGLHP